MQENPQIAVSASLEKGATNPEANKLAPSAGLRFSKLFYPAVVAEPGFLPCRSKLRGWHNIFLSFDGKQASFLAQLAPPKQLIGIDSVSPAEPSVKRLPGRAPGQLPPHCYGADVADKVDPASDGLLFTAVRRVFLHFHEKK